MTIQHEYNRFHTAARVGMVSRPLPVAEYVSGKLTIPASGVAPRPGDAVRYVAASNDFRLPTTKAEAYTCCGIIAPPPAAIGEAADGTFVHKSGDILRIMIQGVMWVRAGAALEFGDAVAYDGANAGNHDYIKVAPVDVEKIDDYPRVPMIVVSTAPVADGGIAEVRLAGWVY